LYSFSTVFFVNSTADDSTLVNTLRGAIRQAELSGGTNTINVAAGTYTLTEGSILFGNKAETITIVGAGASTTRIIMGTGFNQDRIFLINLTGLVPNVNVTISGITFSNGFLVSDPFGGSAILCGGPRNVISLQNCVFTGNSLDPGLGANGGAVAMEGGGALTINGCTFSNNSDGGGNGGALYYTEPGEINGALTITNSIFTGNSCTQAGSQGGALLVSTTADTLSLFTSTISITGNTFTGNTVVGSGSVGGAISIDNAFLPGNTAFINYNRFYGNKAATIPDVVVGDAQGNVDISNNWWGRNASPVGTDPHALQQGTSGGGTMPFSPWLELHCTETASTLCGGSDGSTVVTANFTTNSSNGAVSTSNLGALIGLPVTFSATLGALAGSQGTIQSNGAATVDFTPSASSGSAAVQAVVDSVPASDVIAQAAYTLVAPGSLPTGSSSGTIVIGGTEPVTDGSCNEIATIAATGASPVSGSVTASVTIDPSVQSDDGQPYLTRHYDITPASNASTATATVTLYFLQSEFNAYNAVVNNPSAELPTSASDALGKANLTITQFHGSGTAPGNYSGWTGPGPASVLISPGSSNVVWNSAKNWWEVSFPVTGFSGFYVTGPTSLPLPVVLEHFGGMLQGTGVLLNWQVGVETGLLRYEVQGSADGVVFGLLGAVAAAGGSASAGAGGGGATAAGAGAYQYFVADPSPGENYYRLKMVNTDGTFAYSPVVVVDVTEGGRGVEVLGNPMGASCMVRVTAESGGPVRLRLTDISGKVLWRSERMLGVGVNTFPFAPAGALARGVYLLTVSGGQVEVTVKVVKE
jgi:hypothetical protein